MIRITVRSQGETLLAALDALTPRLREAGIASQKVEAITVAPAQPEPETSEYDFVVHIALDDVVEVTT